MGKIAKLARRETVNIHKAYWKPITEEIRTFCHNYSIIKTRNDFLKGGAIVLIFIVLTIISIIHDKSFNLLHLATLIIAVSIGVLTYRMSFQFQKAIHRTIYSDTGEYTLVTLKDIKIDEFKEEGKNFFSRKQEVRTYLTLGFPDGDEVIQGAVEKPVIGGQVLLVKTDNVTRLDSQFCFKIAYAQED